MLERKSPTWGEISPERPLIILQTNNRFGDSEEGFGDPSNPLAEAAAHGREAVRAWREALPDRLKPYCQLQIETRVQNHEARYQRFRRLLDELQAAEIPVNLQFADPHDQYVFDPEYVERLTEAYPCIQSYTLTEINYEYYRSFNVPRYAISPEARYAMDIIEMAARHGMHVSIALQCVKWMHIGADVLNRPLLDAVRAHGRYVLPVNEHIGPQHLPRQTSVWGLWMAGITEQWGVEPQSWWFENARMITPGHFGQYQASNTRTMPAGLYRAMILQGALLGATVYQFEPFWDLFDYDNSDCWREVICPALIEVIERRLIPTRAQLREKCRVAYQYKAARDINEFHENLRDVDWIHDEGLLAKAAYGLWERFLEHELVPNRHKNFFIPLLPPNTPDDVLAQYDHVIRPGECDSVEAYERLLDRYYPGKNREGEAWRASVNGYTYVMQTHENLYERQRYAVDLPRPVRGLTARRTEEGVALEWPADPGASAYLICRAVGEASETMPLLASARDARYLDTTAEPDVDYVYGVSARTTTLEQAAGTVNYLDYRVFSETESALAELAYVRADGTAETLPWSDRPDTRPESQVVYPTFDGVPEAHRPVADAIVARLDGFKRVYDAGDWRGVHALYSAAYKDANGYGHEYAGRAWKWWAFRCNTFCFLRQIRWWDFRAFEEDGSVRVHLFALCRATRRDDAPFGSGYDGSLRIPRTPDEEVTFTWRRDDDGAWRIVHTDPALPNFQEMLWCSRGADQYRVKLNPGKDGEPEYMPEGQTNLIPIEDDWLPKPVQP